MNRLAQRIVLYGSGRGKVFDTAYSEGQTSDAILHCIELHGVASNPRAVVLKQRTKENA